MNSSIYPEEVEHLARLYGEPRRVTIPIEVDPEFFRAFHHSLQRRRAEVALVILREEGRVLVTTKTFYPAGVFRIPTGGINPGESVDEALWREFQEETGLVGSNARFGALIEYRVTSGPRAVRFATYLFLIDAREGIPECIDPHEDISEYRELTPEELKDLAQMLTRLGPNWKSWGAWRAVPHQVAYEILKERFGSGSAPSHQATEPSVAT